MHPPDRVQQTLVAGRRLLLLRLLLLLQLLLDNGFVRRRRRNRRSSQEAGLPSAVVLMGGWRSLHSCPKLQWLLLRLLWRRWRWVMLDDSSCRQGQVAERGCPAIEHEVWNANDNIKNVSLIAIEMETASGVVDEPNL